MTKEPITKSEYLACDKEMRNQIWMRFKDKPGWARLLKQWDEEDWLERLEKKRAEDNALLPDLTDVEKGK